MGREHSFDRIIVHFTLPHLTFVADALEWEPGDIDSLMNDPVMGRELKPEEESHAPVQRGEVPAAESYDLYRKNLRLGLEYVNILLENYDAERVVVTSDHGEGFGRKSVYGHPYGYPFSPIKTVPWAETVAVDEETYEPRYE